jgi:membrane associated rhomboid family serine protease
MDGTAGQTLAAQIAAHCVAREGFAPGVPPEAAELSGACDIVLTRLNWGTLHIVCLVDGEAHPGKQFGLMPGRVQEIAKACQKYSGRINFTKMPAIVEIVEIGKNATSDQDRARLRHYRRSSMVSKAVVLASRVDATTRAVWNNRWSLGKRTAERALRAGPVSPAELQTAIAESSLPVRQLKPVITWVILALLAAVFALELAVAGGNLSSATLISLGGINQKLVFAGEWWRAIAATVLHANFNHLLGNGISLMIAGAALEGMVGRAWFGAIYVVSALAGAAASIWFGTTFLVSVGASGAVLGVAAAAAVCGLARRRRDFGMEAVRLLISVFIPTLGMAVWGGPAAAHVDHFAHFGGAIGGALTALMLLPAWKKTEPLPGARPVALGIVAAGCLALAAAAVEVSLHRAADKVTLVPDSSLPRDSRQRVQRLSELVEQYPGDPRTYFAAGAIQWQGQQLAEAEASFRKALALDRTLTLYFPPALGLQIRSALSGVLLIEHKDNEAHEVGKPICGLAPDDKLLDDRLKSLQRALCR